MHVNLRPDHKGLPLSVSEPNSVLPRIKTYVLLVRSESTLTKGLAGRLRSSGSRQASHHSSLQYLFFFIANRVGFAMLCQVSESAG
jgi:hypothetical protein